MFEREIMCPLKSPNQNCFEQDFLKRHSSHKNSIWQIGVGPIPLPSHPAFPLPNLGFQVHKKHNKHTYGRIFQNSSTIAYENLIKQ